MDSSSTDPCSTDSSPPDLSEEKSKYVFSYFLCQGYPSRARKIYYKDVDLPSKPQSLSDIGHVSCNPSKIHQRDHEMAFSTRPQLTSLLLVCKHIHLSASRILYSSNTWCFTEDIDPFETLPMFCASLSPSASASLRKVVLVLPLTRDYWDDVWIPETRTWEIQNIICYRWHGILKCLRGLSGLRVLSLELDRTFVDTSLFRKKHHKEIEVKGVWPLRLVEPVFRRLIKLGLQDLQISIWNGVRVGSHPWRWYRLARTSDAEDSINAGLLREQIDFHDMKRSKDHVLKMG